MHKSLVWSCIRNAATDDVPSADRLRWWLDFFCLKYVTVADAIQLLEGFLVVLKEVLDVSVEGG